MNNTTSLPGTISDAQVGFILGISLALTITIVIINALTIQVIRTVDALREKYGILLVAYCSVDILNGIYVTYLQVRLWVLIFGVVKVCEWKEVLLYSFDTMTFSLSSWHTVLLTFDRYIAVCYPFRYHKIMSPKIQKILIVVVWVISILENFGPQVYFIAFKCENMLWTEPDNVEIRLQFGHLTVIFTLHLIMYSRIWWIAHKMRQRSVQVLLDNQSVKRGILDKATMTVFCVVVLSLCDLDAIYDDSLDSRLLLFRGFLYETYNYYWF